MCAVLEISPNTYYKYRNKKDPDYYNYLVIKEIFDDSKCTYGYRRIVEDLRRKYGFIMNRKKVLRIMKKYNLMPNYIRRAKKKNKNENCKKANVKQIRMHDFRHSCASLLINQNANITLISKYLGHTDIAITLNTYSHFFNNEFDYLMEK